MRADESLVNKGSKKGMSQGYFMSGGQKTVCLIIFTSGNRSMSLSRLPGSPPFFTIRSRIWADTPYMTQDSTLDEGPAVQCRCI